MVYSLVRIRLFLCCQIALNKMYAGSLAFGCGLVAMFRITFRICSFVLHISIGKIMVLLIGSLGRVPLLLMLLGGMPCPLFVILSMVLAPAMRF